MYIKQSGLIEIIKSPKSLELEEYQKFLGGYIELTKINYYGKIRSAYINEEGSINGMERNKMFPKIYGPIIFRYSKY